MTNLLDAGPLSEVRTLIGGQIGDIINDPDEIATIYTEWQAPAGAAVVIDGGGWRQTLGCGMEYKVRVNCVFGNQSGVANSHVEELARQVFDALRQNNYQVDPVPPPGKLTFDGRDYPACQIIVTMNLSPES